MEAQEAAAAEGPKEDRKIILAGETFKVRQCLTADGLTQYQCKQTNSGVPLCKSAWQSPHPSSLFAFIPTQGHRGPEGDHRGGRGRARGRREGRRVAAVAATAAARLAVAAQGAPPAHALALQAGVAHVHQ